MYFILFIADAVKKSVLCVDGALDFHQGPRIVAAAAR
jgi:hypothetical protein